MALRVIGGEVTAYVGLIDIMLLRDVKIKSRAENSRKKFHAFVTKFSCRYF